MTNICFYFQVHQPFRMKRYKIFDIGKIGDYFDNEKNEEIIKKVAGKCYLPMNKMLLDAIKMHRGNFKVAFSLSGTALEQFELFAPEVIESFAELHDTGCVEMLGETYHHSLSSLFDKNEFKDQIDLHADMMKKYFGIEPKVFRNTELIFYNDLAHNIEMMGYTGMLAEGADHILHGRSPNFVHKSKGSKIPILTKNYKLSDDIAFRFGNKGWEEHPLSAEKFVSWVKPMAGDSVNLFMDYETFGEHQWADTGIFSFMKHLPGEALKHGIGFSTPSEVCATEPRGEIDVHLPVSWADMERDTTAWLGNKMQQSAIKALYDIKENVFETGDHKLIESWRRLTTSDHFYYMCTKWFSDGDVHKYFNPYDTPYDSYLAFVNILYDLSKRVGVKLEVNMVA